MITRIELKNFMSHEHTVIEPARGLTVIAGPNNCGKSAIVTALQILCYNDESTFVTRHGEKECSIKVFTDDGHEVEWIRTKNKSTKYIIDGQQHDRLGRGGTPDELHQALRIKKVNCDNTEFDVHFGAQQSPVFLLNDSPRAAAQFFASSSDAINLIGMQTRHKQKVRDRKQEQRRLTVELDRVNNDLERLDTVPEISDDLSKLETRHKELCTAEEEIAALHNLLKAIEEKSLELKRLNLESTNLQTLPVPPKIVETDGLAELIERINKNQNQWTAMSQSFLCLEPLLPAPELHETEELVSLLRRFDTSNKNFALANAKFAAMDGLMEVPVEEDCGELSNLVTRLAKAEREWAATEKKWEACRELGSPPELNDLSPITTTLAEIIQQSNKLGELEKSIAQSNQELESLRAEIEAFVQVNPSCPTCGSELSADELMRGGHQHD